MPLLHSSALTPETFFAGPPPVLHGDGFVLRSWRAADAPAVARAFCDPAIRHWMLRSLDEQEAPGWIASRTRRWSARTGVDWAIVAGEDPDGAALLGRIGIHRLALEYGLGEVTYWVAPEHRGRRIAPRALTVLCEWAFGEQALHRLELSHSVSNPASCRVAERAGFVLEGIKRRELRHDDGWHDAHLHARLADDPPPQS